MAESQIVVKYIQEDMNNKKLVRIIYLIIGITIVVYFYNHYEIKVHFIDGFRINTCEDVRDKLVTDNDHECAEKRIFFIETSNKGGLNSRQACSVESASKANPDWTIYVFIVGHIDVDYDDGNSYRILSTLQNVHLIEVNATEFTKGTKVESLYKRNVFANILNPEFRHADVLRMAVLNKYGGLYLDLDMIVIKSFDSLPQNFAARQSMSVLAAGIIRLSRQGVGRQMSDWAVEDLSENFNQIDWTSNGPDLITRALKKICMPMDVIFWDADSCQGIEIFDQYKFYPINYRHWRRYYAKYSVVRKSFRKDVYTHHVWNALANHTRITSRSLFAQLAREHCPRMFYEDAQEFGQRKLEYFSMDQGSSPVVKHIII